MSSKERHIMTTNQLELGFNGTQGRIYGRRRKPRVARAKWWFAKMREAVENAWQEQTQAKPEQIIFPGVNREMHV
jgi:hypothetical protein